jgi:hypothetical protein
VVVVASLAGSTLALVGGSLSPTPLTETPMDNPIALAGVAGTVATVVGNLGSLLHTACLPVALVCVVLRFRASRGVERQQLRWVAAGAAGAVAGLLAGTFLPQQTLISGVLYAMVLCVPVAVAVAVLRYRLWDLDRLVSRTVTYAVVTALLVVPYLLIVPTASKLVEGAGSLAVAAATLTVAALFQPLRRRVQELWSTAASTAAAMTPPAPSSGSRPACATRSTWTPCTPSCWPWSTTPCSQRRRRCGCGPRQQCPARPAAAQSANDQPGATSSQLKQTSARSDPSIEEGVPVDVD